MKTLTVTDDQALMLKALICDHLNDLGIIDYPEDANELVAILKQIEDALQLQFNF